MREDSVFVCAETIEITKKTDKALLIKFKQKGNVWTDKVWIPKSRMLKSNDGMEIERWILRRRNISTLCISCQEDYAEVDSFCSFCYSIKSKEVKNG